MTAREYILSLPERISSETIDGINTSFYFDIEGEEGIKAKLTVKDNEIILEEGDFDDAKCEVAASSENFEKVINKEMKPFNAVFSGKVKVSKPGELMKYAKAFGLA